MGSEAMSPHVMKKLAKPMLFAAAIIWGTSFFVMKNALDVIPVFYLLAIRFTAGAVLLAAVCWKKWAGFTRDYLWRGAVIGAFLFLAYSVQTFGLDRTTPSKNAFLTAVYCVIVPFLYWAAARRRPDRYNIRTSNAESQTVEARCCPPETSNTGQRGVRRLPKRRY